MSERMPTSVHQGSIFIMGVELKVHVLDDGRRIIASDSFVDFLRALEDGPQPTKEEMEALARFMKGTEPHA